MRILHVISSLAAGGAEIYVRNLSQLMVEQGHSVAIAYISESMAVDRSVVAENNFRIHLESHGIECFRIGNTCKRNPLLGAWRLRRIISHFKADIVHCHLYSGLIFKILSFTKAPLIYTHHSLGFLKGKRLFFLFNHFVNCYIGISQLCANALSQVSGREVKLIYNGTPITPYVSRNPSEKKLRIINVGRLDANKNQKLLIEAAGILNSRGIVDFVIDIAGEGELHSTLSTLITSLRLEGKVRLLGNRCDIEQLLACSDVFVLTSKIEGLPISLLEAIASGCACVVTDAGACREVIERLKCGEIVQDFEASTFAWKLEKLINDRKMLAKYQESALSGREIFSIKKSLSQHLNLYNSCLK